MARRRSSHCHPQISQSTSRRSSARGRETGTGSDRGVCSFPFKKGETRSQRCHGHTRSAGMNHPRTRLQRAECPDTEDNARGHCQRTGNNCIQKDTDEMASLKRRESSVICSFRKSALLVEAPRGIAERDTAVRAIPPTRTASRHTADEWLCGV